MIIFENEISTEIKSINPKKIAVAYIGKDWKKYINPSSIDFIILSPTIGSNPYAIEELEKAIGWEKIYFNDSLHAKIYRAEDSAIIGSANLTNNGLSGDRLIECCSKITSQKDLNRIDDILEKIKKYSIDDELLKKEKLLNLKRIFNNLNLSENTKNQKILADKDKRYHVCWYHDCELEYTKETKNTYPNIEDISQLNFHPNDDIEVGDYVLQWRTTLKNTPHKTIKPSWFRIDKILKNGVIDDDQDTNYTTLTLQLKQEDLPLPDIDKKSFDLLITQEKYNKLLDRQKGPWRTNLSLSKDLLKDLGIF